MAEQEQKMVIIFLDVDGVLNDKWIGHVPQSPSASDKAGSLHPHLVDNLAKLVSRFESELGLDPKLVLSTTWRLQQHSCAKLLSSFAKIKVHGEKTLDQYLLKYGADDVRSWVTPDLAHGTTPEGRVAEIQGWLFGHCRQTNNESTGRRSDLIFLVLDDLDLLYTDTGKRNESIDPQNFVCTVSYRGYDQVDGTVGLTQERVELALQKVRQQSETRKMRLEGTGKWTEGEWAVLSASNELQPHLQALRSNECPSWIAAIAKRHVDSIHTRKKKEGGQWWKRRRRKG